MYCFGRTSDDFGPQTIKEIDQGVLAQFPLNEIDRVTFYKRDELTTDLICCEVHVGESHSKFHEELIG